MLFDADFCDLLLFVMGRACERECMQHSSLRRQSSQQWKACSGFSVIPLPQTSAPHSSALGRSSVVARALFGLRSGEHFRRPAIKAQPSPATTGFHSCIRFPCGLSPGLRQFPWGNGLLCAKGLF